MSFLDAKPVVCDGSATLYEVLTPRLDYRDPAYSVREWPCPGCPNCIEMDESEAAKLSAAERRVRPRLLDAFCKAGGAAMGYHRAGFEVVGIDIEPQPNYPFRFIQADALTFLGYNLRGMGYAAVHASPPCQAHSALRTLQGDKEYPDLVAPVRELLRASRLPYVIENVEGAPLENPVRICGSGIGLPLLRRHRLFECSFPAMGIACAHGVVDGRRFPALNGADRKRGGRSGIVGVYGNGGDKRADLWPEAMGIDWMTRQELTQAIPPAYTEHIGTFLMAAVRLVPETEGQAA